MTLTDEELVVLRTLRAGGCLLVGPNPLLFVEGEKPFPVSGEVWRHVYELDLVRRGKMVGNEYRKYGLTEHGRTVDIAPKSQ